MSDFPARAASVTSIRTVRVWDGFVRLSHWGIVAFFLVSYYETMDPFIHENAGYILLFLVLARIAWGFVGPEHARFISFVRSPVAAVGYLMDLPRGRAQRSLGHNPAGGWMVVVLLVMLTVVSVSGIVMNTHRYWGDPVVERIHYWSADLTMGLAILHVCGVIASSLAHRENLVLAMITGRKRLDTATPAPETDRPPRAGVTSHPPPAEP